MRSNLLPVWRAAGACLAVVALVSCGGSGGPSGPSGPTQAVSATENIFTPAQVTVTAGTTLEWTNNGNVVHNVVSADLADLFVEPAKFAPGATYHYRFTKPGTYHYYCSIHGTAAGGGQQGVVVVTG
jgi:plastocyanin